MVRPGVPSDRAASAVIPVATEGIHPALREMATPDAASNKSFGVQIFGVQKYAASMTFLRQSPPTLRPFGEVGKQGTSERTNAIPVGGEEKVMFSSRSRYSSIHLVGLIECVRSLYQIPPRLFLRRQQQKSVRPAQSR